MNWEQEKAVIETSLFAGSQNIAEKIRFCSAVSRVGLQPHQVQAVVHDEARNADFAGHILKERHDWASVTGGAHLIQTWVYHVLEDLKPVMKLPGAARKLVGHFHHSNKGTEALLAKQVQKKLQ